MFIIVNKSTNKIVQTIDINYGIEVNENQLLQEVTNDILAEKIRTAHDYTLIFTDGIVTDINVIQTIAAYQTPSLEQIKQQKILELNTACNQTILGGFPSSCTGVEYQYKFDMEYQGNFAQQGVMLSLDPTIETVMWPTSVGVIPHTREQFIQLCKDAQGWKATNVYRYFGMKAQVEACTEIADVEQFAW